MSASHCVWISVRNLTRKHSKTFLISNYECVSSIRKKEEEETKKKKEFTIQPINQLIEPVDNNNKIGSQFDFETDEQFDPLALIPWRDYDHGFNSIDDHQQAWKLDLESILREWKNVYCIDSVLVEKWIQCELIYTLGLTTQLTSN